MADRRCPYCKDDRLLFHNLEETKAVIDCSSCDQYKAIPQEDLESPRVDDCDCGGAFLIDFLDDLDWINCCKVCDGYSWFSNQDGYQYPLNDKDDPASGRL